MKKIYLLSSALLLAVTTFAQEIIPGLNTAVGTYQGPYSLEHAANRAIICPDTALLTNYFDFFPEFLPSTGGGLYIFSYTGGGYIFGNNLGNWNVFAQGYDNVNDVAVKVQGAIVWFRYKERDLSGGASSRVMVGLYEVKPNEGYNKDVNGNFQETVKNWPGPSTRFPLDSAFILFDDIDTVPKNYTIRGNYVAFNTPRTFLGDFAIGVNARPTLVLSNVANLTAGDTVGILSDAAGDAGGVDYLWHQRTNGKWLVTNQMFTVSGSGINNTAAVFAVLCDATGINEFFNGMKLTAYPTPADAQTTIEYTLEKNSRNVSLTVFDLLGKEISLVELGAQNAGTYKVNLETASLPAGNYFYQLRANGYNFTKKITVSH